MQPQVLLDETPQLVDILGREADHFRQETREMRPEYVLRMLREEENRFGQLLERGRQVLAQARFQRDLSEEDFHYLHDTHGLPRELITSLREG